MSQSSSLSSAHLAKLRRNLTRLPETDLRNFCFDRGIDYDGLPTTNLSVPDKARALVDYLNQRGRIAELIAWGKAEFSNLDWDDNGSPTTTPPVGRPLRVFLCHSSKDKPAVRKLYQRLKSQGIQPWLDEEDILPGQDWDREIRKAVASSDVILVCLSKNSTGATGYLQREIQSVLDAADEQPKDSIFVIPLKLEECAVPERLSKWQWVSYYDERGYNRLLRAFDERAKSVRADFVMSVETAPPTGQMSAPTGVPRSRLLALGSAVVLLLIVAAVILVIRSASNQPQPGALSPTPSSAPTNFPLQTSVAQDAPTATVEPQPTTPPIPVATQLPIAAATMAPEPTMLPPSTSAPTLTLELAPGVQMEFVRVPAGEFLMGSDLTKDSLAQDNEQPQHRVDLSEYYIGKYEVTNAQYAVFAKESGRDFQIPVGKEAHPVVKVSWNDAVAFSDWLSKKTGKTIRLPTEAEWEKACRGTAGRIWPWGDQFDPKRLNSSGGGAGDTSPVGKYSPAGDSPYGAADMSGNVWEWTADWYYKTQYKSRPKSSLLIKDPTGPASGTYRAMRGGAFVGYRTLARCARRDGTRPTNVIDGLGFRVVARP